MSQKIKTIILILIAIVIIGLVGLLIYNKGKNKEPDSGNHIKPPMPEQLKEQVEKSAEAEPHYDKLYIISRQAAREQNPEYCEQLDGYDREGCIYKIVASNSDGSLCELIETEEIKQRCKDIVLMRELIENNDIDRCEEIVEKEYRGMCFKENFSKSEDIDICIDYDDETKSICESIVYGKIASRDSDMSMCSKIPLESYREICKTAINNIPKDTDGDGITDKLELGIGTNMFKADTDDDGLNDAEELRKYLTNPKLSDTDGDGFSDGDEVEAGYNPKGEGIL